jgi:hypothetical protein
VDLFRALVDLLGSVVEIIGSGMESMGVFHALFGAVTDLLNVMRGSRHGRDLLPS